MFNTAELGRTVSKDEYHELAPELRARLVQTQYQMRDANFSAIVVISGIDTVGRMETLNLLHEWMDVRYIHTHAFGDPTEEQRHRPQYWRYWVALPPNGRIAIYFGSWARRPLMDRIDDCIDEAAFEAEINAIDRLERTLVDDGTLLFKFWLHLGRDELRKRLNKADKDPDTAWQVSQRDWNIVEDYDRAINICTRFVRKTSTSEAPWMIVESTDDRYRNLTVVQTILDALTRRLEAAPESDAAPPQQLPAGAISVPTPASGNGHEYSILDTVDLQKSLDRDEYRQKLEKYQGRLHRLGQRAYRQELTSVLVFEGWDAAGKGGAIRRMVRTLDPRDYRVLPISAPNDEEKSRHYLWRFWRHLPRRGKLMIFDRSWYGRVLVERVEGFATEAEWRRAYKEINDFEETLVEHGILLLKFWMHIDADEQLRRFQAREATPFKQHKIGPEDYRNREKWDEYEAAVNEMVQRTSTEYAPWHLVEGNDKRYARIRVLRTFCQALEERLGKP